MRGATLFAAVAAVTMAASADTYTWTGGGANKNWSTAANWSPSGTMTASDTANFQTGTLSSDTIIYDSGAFSGITVQSGAWTANVASASFTGKPITVSSGATFALKNAGSVTNPFSTTKNANAISGLLDLGGASQTITDAMDGDNTGFFRNGGEIRNGNLAISGSTEAHLKNTTFTIGPGANLTGAVRYYLYYGANLIIDGGSLTSTTGGNNHPIGTSSGYVYVRVKNGGKLTLAKPVWLGFSARGFLIGDNGTIDFGSNDLYLSVRDNTTGVLALTNSTLTCGRILFGYSSTYPTPNTQTLSMKDSVAVISKFVGSIAATTSSSIRFDGAVLVPKAAATDFLPNSAILPTPMLGAGGLIVSNSYDVTIAKGLAGAGKLVKEGDAMLTLAGAHTFTGGIDLREGTLALDPNVSLANSTLTMSEGSTLKLKYTPGVGFVTSNLTAALDASTSGNVTLDIDTSDGLPEEERAYTLFASVLDAASLSRISILPDALFTLAVADGGAVTITLRHVPVTHVWTGGGADAKWTTLDNWDTNGAWGTFDSVVFGGTGSYSIYDCGDVLITNLTVESGAHTANVASAGFSGFPVTVASGAEFKLEDAGGVANPFSTEMNANTISGILDLGGATQTISTSLNGTGTFRDGGEIRNGTVTLVSSNWGQFFDNTTFTIGADANVTSTSRFYCQNGAHFRIDGGTFINASSKDNHVVGAGDSGSFSTLEVSNGGRVVTVYGEFFLGHIANTHGALIGDGGIIDLGARTIYLCNNPGTKATLALTNSVLTCGNLQFSYGTGNAISTQTLVLKSTLVNLSGFIFKRKADDSSILFDGATFVPTGAAANFMPSGLPSPVLGTGGVVISNAYDVGVAASMTGVGGIVKKGDGVLTLSSTNNSFTGGIDVREGVLSLGSSAVFADSTLAMASGTTLRFKYSPNCGFATSNLVLSLDENLEGKVTIEIDTSAGLPEVNSTYPLFASGLDAASLGRITVDSAYELAISDGGAVTLTFSPTTHTWTGGGADEMWTTTANWDTDDAFKTFDHVVFNSATGHSIYDCADGLGLGSITAMSGVHTANVATACFANVPVTVASGAVLALEDAEGVTNAFSTVANTNAVFGILDLGGSTQTISDSMAGNNTGFFRDGGELRNGTLMISGSPLVYLTNTTFTIGPGADVSGAVRVRLQNGANLEIDGGSFTATYYVNANYNNHPIGDGGGTAVVTVRNGGRFVSTSAPVWLGFTANAIMNGDGGSVDLYDNSIVMTVNNNWESVLALTNSTFTCGVVHFGYGTGDTYKSPGAQTMILKDSVANITRFNGNACNENSSIFFDGATLVPKSEAANFLPNSATIPSPMIGAGGLIVSNAYDITIAKGMAGVGGLVKMGDGALTVSANQSFTGDVVVSGGTFTSSSTFAGGLQAASGTTLDVANATFGGNIAIADGVVLPATNGVNWAEVKSVPIAKTTAGVSFPEGRDVDGRHFFVRSSNGMNVLYFGKQRGLMIMVR